MTNFSFIIFLYHFVYRSLSFTIINLLTLSSFTISFIHTHHLQLHPHSYFLTTLIFFISTFISIIHVLHQHSSHNVLHSYSSSSFVSISFIHTCLLRLVYFFIFHLFYLLKIEMLYQTPFILKLVY